MHTTILLKLFTIQEKAEIFRAAWVHVMVELISCNVLNQGIIRLNTRLKIEKKKKKNLTHGNFKHKEHPFSERTISQEHLSI